MSNKPDYADDIVLLLTERGAHITEIPVIQPADPFLDMAGEDLRRRIFLTESETGASLCLRPEFTIPVCLKHIETASGTPQRYAYLGQVFRQHREGGSEFFQAGVEDLGNNAIAQADATAMRDASDTLKQLLPGSSLQTTIGDQTVFEAVVAALGLPHGWQTRLIRAFGDAAQLDGMLQNLSQVNTADCGLDDEAAPLVGADDLAGLTDLIDSRMKATGYLTNASRTPAEIAQRLIQKTQLSSTRLDAKALDILKMFLALDAPLRDAPEALAAFARIAGLDINTALVGFNARVDAMEHEGFDLAQTRYRAAFGRPLDYYTGLVFEISAQGSVLAGGGRFDRLLTLLGANAPIPAVGFSLWLDRITHARAGLARMAQKGGQSS